MSLPRFLRVMVALLFAVIALQAIPSRPLPHYIESGSAFSASTAEVAIAQREDGAEQALVAPADSYTFLVAPIEIWHEDARPAHFWPGRYQTAPPLPWPRSPADTQRGPPVLS